MAWTKEQQQVIDLRNRNLLVSAAAGSGKTAVLVERILALITQGEHPIDIDKLLVVTFTNAAAGEMRERIGNAIEHALEQQPDNVHLQKQLTLVHNAQITTIDSFCLYVVRNFFYETDLEPNFRIGDMGEMDLLKSDVADAVLEEYYREKKPEFLEFVESYATGKDDKIIKEFLLSLFEYSMSYPWPKEWLMDGKKQEDEGTPGWIAHVMAYVEHIVADCKKKLEIGLSVAEDSDGPNMYAKTMEEDLQIIEAIENWKDFETFEKGIKGVAFPRLAAARKFEGDEKKKEFVKGIHTQVKEALDMKKGIGKKFFTQSYEEMLDGMKKVQGNIEVLVDMTLTFIDLFQKEKREKNIVDFSDMEHFALDILMDPQTKQPTQTAQTFQDAFYEIMIDEYQDSNHVQETILTSISKESKGRNNLFMVGDVKQSIYGFRLARPELFMEKYDTYTREDSDKQKIELQKNFRSRGQVLTGANDIFEKIMHRDLGNVEYDTDAALYQGNTSFEGEGDTYTMELLITEEKGNLAQPKDKKELEAMSIARKIRQMKKQLKVTDKESGKLRELRYSDIVILLRSPSGWAEDFTAVLEEANIPVQAESQTGYFDTTEVQTMLSYLRIIDNPKQDIPLAGVLKSPIGGFSEEELARMKGEFKDVSFHKGFFLYEEQGQEEALKEKVIRFTTQLNTYRRLSRFLPIYELLQKIYQETGYFYYAAALPNGRIRKSNLEMLLERAISYASTSFKGLFHFIRYIDRLQKYDIDLGAGRAGETRNDMVTIMSIHKSKGLEFPVVIVAGMGKQFNLMDTRGKLLIDSKYGLALDVMDPLRRVKIPSMKKKILANRSMLETLGEELRILYVALTRAKEKLIISGTIKDGEKKMEAMSTNMDYLEGEMDFSTRSSARTYLDWILPAAFSYGSRYPLTYLRPEQLVEEESQRQVRDVLSLNELLFTAKEVDAQVYDIIAKRLSFEYPHKDNANIKTKMSVSEIKHKAMEVMEEEEHLDPPEFLVVEKEPLLPKFITHEETEANQGALRGTAMHRVMECLSFGAFVELSKEEIQTELEKQLAEILEQGKMSKESMALVSKSKVRFFLSSPLGKRMGRWEQAGLLVREQPFVMGKPAYELVEDTQSEELILVQGIVDAYFEEEDGLVIVDYKTDRVNNPEELVNRYRKQLDLYQEALTKATGKKVKEKLLYSFTLGKAIPIL